MYLFIISSSSIYLFISSSIFFPSSLLSLIFEISDLMFSDWVSFLAYPNLFVIKGFVVVVVVVVVSHAPKYNLIHISILQF
jgi:hypothetical protein